MMSERRVSIISRIRGECNDMNELKKSKILHEIPEAMLEKYIYNCRIETFRKKEIAFTPNSNNEYMYLILCGRIRVTLNYPNGKEFTIALLYKGDVYSGHARGLGIALEETEVVFLPMRMFREMLLEYPSFAVNILAAVGSTLEATFNVIENLVFRDVNERIYAFLLSMAESKGEVKKEGIEIALGLTQEELATMVGSTRQTVNSVLTNLLREGIISINKKNLIVHDKDKLKSYISENE